MLKMQSGREGRKGGGEKKGDCFSGKGILMFRPKCIFRSIHFQREGPK